MHQDSASTWAWEEYGHATLGDPRRGARLLEVAAQVARRPRGAVTAVFDEPAEREGAYRFLENDHFSYKDLQAAAQVAAARRAAAHPFVYVATDQTALQITDESRQIFGPLSRKDMGTGAQAMTALMLSPAGVPLGLAAQELWTRKEERVQSTTKRRPVSERETQFWLDVMSHATAALEAHAPGTLPWFLCDRGADATHVLLHAAKLGVGYTIRSSYNRRIRTARGGRYLHDTLAASAVLGRYTLLVRRRPGIPQRTAQIEVRAREVTLDLADGPSGGAPTTPFTLWAVEAREVNTDVKEPVLWRLLTNRVVSSFGDALDVIHGYTMRWGVEDFHLAWKSGTCGIEVSRLRSLESFAKWATLLATVAVQAQRLKRLLHETPDVPADTEFSRDEIDAVILLRKPKGVAIGATPTLGTLIRWIADYGGYTGKSSGGPPGVRIISRALIEVNAAANALATLRASRPSG
jgi:hypothetical protein